jgi:hypothetical protein
VGVSAGNLALDVRQSATSSNTTPGQEDAVVLFPVPAHDMVYLETTATIRELELISPMGVVLEDAVFTPGAPCFSLSAYPDGLYTVKVTLEQGRHQTFRIVKQ